MDEVLRNDAAQASQSFWELNQFDDWDVKLVVTCREEHLEDYGGCMGDKCRTLYLRLASFAWHCPWA